MDFVYKEINKIVFINIKNPTDPGKVLIPIKVKINPKITGN